MAEENTGAEDADKWITVKPNGPDHKGAHVKIDGETGRVKAGMGGKFNGEKIGEVRKDFTGPKSAAPTEPSRASGPFPHPEVAAKSGPAPAKADKVLTDVERHALSKSEAAWKAWNSENPDKGRGDFKESVRKGDADHLRSIAEKADQEHAVAEKARKDAKNAAWREKHLPKMVEQKQNRALKEDEHREAERQEREKLAAELAEAQKNAKPEKATNITAGHSELTEYRKIVKQTEKGVGIENRAFTRAQETAKYDVKELTQSQINLLKTGESIRWLPKSSVSIEGGHVVGVEPWVAQKHGIPVHQSEQELKAKTERTYLNVRYEDKDQAKAAGAKWDPDKRKWYHPGGELPEKLQKFAASPSASTYMPKPAASQQSPGRLFASSNPPSQGATQEGGSWVVYEKTSKRVRIDENHPSVHGSHLLGYEGEQGEFYSRRAATEAEIKSSQEAPQAKPEKSWAYSSEAVQRALRGEDSADMENYDCPAEDGSDDPENYGEDVSVNPHAAGVMFLGKGKMLLLKRGADAVHGGTWCFPGGKVEEGEATLAAARREALEEVGQEPAEELPLVGAFEGFALYLCECDPFIPTLNWEHDGYVWATKDDLPQPLHPGVIDQIAEAQKHTAEARAAMAGTGEDKSAREHDINGYYEVKRNPLSKVGVFPYLGRSLPGAPDPSALYQVYRPSEELSDPECIASFRLLPWIDDHVMLGPEDKGLTPAEKKGVEGVIGEDVFFDPEAFEAGGLFGNLKVFSQTLSALIEDGKRELSAGYRCVYEWTSGTFRGQPYDCIQRRIRGNHIALVESGRMGPEVSVLDGSALDQLTFSIDAKEIDMPEVKKDEGTPNGVSLDQSDIASLKALAKVAPALVKLAGTGKDSDDEPKDGEKKKGDGEDEDDPDKAKADEPKAKDEDPDAKKDDEKKGEGMDAAAVKRLAASTATAAAAVAADAAVKAALAGVSRRNDLADRLSRHVGTFDHSTMTEAEVAAYGVKKLGLSDIPAGHEATALRAYLAAKPAPSALASHGLDDDGSENAVTKYLKGA